MDYLLFNNELFISEGQGLKRVEKGPGLNDIEKARVCCVDVDVMIASAPQDHWDKKDSILAQKFEAVYSNGYITLSEKIDNNIFQVIGIKADTVRKTYALAPSPQVETFVPYAIAIRSFLKGKGTDMAKTIIFIDDLGNEKLMTVFENQKFSRTRTINTDKAEDILSDIKRSRIDFNKKLGEFIGKEADGNFRVISNNKQMLEGIEFLEQGLLLEHVDCRWPAFEGLKYTDTQIKYRVHEEIILERKKKELHIRLKYLMVSIVICLTGALFGAFNRITYSFLSRDVEGEKFKNSRLKEAINQIDPQIYRELLRKSKYLDYAGVFFEVSGLLPSTYEISSFKFSDHEDHWTLETYVFAQDDQFYDDIPRIKMLKSAEIKDFFIRNRPGKYLRVLL